MLYRFAMGMVAFFPLLGCQLLDHQAKMRALTVRLAPSQDIRKELEALAQKENLKAATIVGAVGSVKHVALRFADQKGATEIDGPHEIVSLSGHFSIDGLHAHMSVADKKGQVVGGHLMEGNLVYTTLELTILENETLQFLRTPDPASGFKELDVQPRDH